MITIPSKEDLGRATLAGKISKHFKNNHYTVIEYKNKFYFYSSYYNTFYKFKFDREDEVDKLLNWSIHNTPINIEKHNLNERKQKLTKLIS
jgi:hypothetical protein